MPRTKSDAPTTDITGQTFGHIYVNRMGRKSTSRGFYAICTCKNCGKEDIYIRPNNLTTSKKPSRSCGCDKSYYDLRVGENNVRFTGYKDIRGKWWYALQTRIKLKGFETDITIEDVWDVYEKQGRVCALSGLPIKFERTNAYSTASLDRIDNSLGYLKTNIQLVHKDVNYMKGQHEQNYFKNLCKLIAERSE